MAKTESSVESNVETPQDHLLTIEEAAKYLRTTVSTMRYWQGLGKGPSSFKLGVRRLYRVSALNRFIEEAERQVSA